MASEDVGDLAKQRQGHCVLMLPAKHIGQAGQAVRDSERRTGRAKQRNGFAVPSLGQAIVATQRGAVAEARQRIGLQQLGLRRLRVFAHPQVVLIRLGLPVALAERDGEPLVRIGQRQRIAASLGDLHRLHRQRDRLVELADAPVHHGHAQHGLGQQLGPVHALQYREALGGGGDQQIDAALVDRIERDVEVGLGLADAVAVLLGQLQCLLRMARRLVGQGQVHLGARQQVQRERPIGRCGRGRQGGQQALGLLVSARGIVLGERACACDVGAPFVERGGARSSGEHAADAQRNSHGQEP